MVTWQQISSLHISGSRQSDTITSTPVVFTRCLFPTGCLWLFKSFALSPKQVKSESWNFSEIRKLPSDNSPVSCLSLKSSVDTEMPGGPHGTGEIIWCLWTRERNHDWCAVYQRKGESMRIHCNILSGSQWRCCLILCQNEGLNEVTFFPFYKNIFCCRPLSWLGE